MTSTITDAPGFGGILVGTARALLIALATAGAAYGLLVIFHPLSPPAATPARTVSVPTVVPGAEALQARIEAVRAALRDTEMALADLEATRPAGSGPVVGDARSGQYDAQILAVTERRDLASRHAGAIRDALKSGGTVSSLAEIRESAVIGQLLSARSAIEAQIAEKSAQLRPAHPVMRALAAQRASLETRIKAEAGSIATALEADARLDDAQIALLQSQASASAVPASAPAIEATDDVTATSTLQAKVQSQRAALDALIDSYLGLRPSAGSAAVAAEAPAPQPLNALNLFVVAVAAAAALLFQILLAMRRRNARRQADELDLWRQDSDPETDPTPVADDESALRRAS